MHCLLHVSQTLTSAQPLQWYTVHHTLCIQYASSTHHTRTPSHCCCWGGGHSIQRTRYTRAYTIHCAYTVHLAYITIWLTSTERAHRVLHRVAGTPCVVHTSHISATPCQWLVHRSTYTMHHAHVHRTRYMHCTPYTILHQELDYLGRVGASSAAARRSGWDR